MSNHLREYIWTMQEAFRVEHKINMLGKLSDVTKYIKKVRTENVRQGQILQNFKY